MTWNWKNRDGATGRMEALQKREKISERTFLLDISEYDVIIGYRADDSYFRLHRILWQG